MKPFQLRISTAARVETQGEVPWEQSHQNTMQNTAKDAGGEPADNNITPADNAAVEPKVAEPPKAAAKKRKTTRRVKKVAVAEILANEIEEKLQGGNLPGAHSEADKNEFGAAATTPNSTESGVVETPNSSTSVPPQNAEGNRNDAAPQPLPAAPAKQRFDIGKHHVKVERNNFLHKGLSSFKVNIATGCKHGCTVCYVPEVATIKQAAMLAQYGVLDPDAEWGNYLLLRPFDEKMFRKSLRRAQKIPRAKLNSDGNRAVIYCSTTDPYQTVSKADSPNYTLLNAARQQLVRRSLELIRDESTLRVRILTRSPLAKEDFELFRSFGPRLVFGMSLPTLDERLMRIYEPKAPGARARLKTLQEAKQAGLHVYVAMAPTYPDCTEADLRATLDEIRKLDPITVFHEPVNIRAENVERIRAHAARIWDYALPANQIDPHELDEVIRPQDGLGTWFLCNPVTGEATSVPRLASERNPLGQTFRAEECLTNYRYMVVESDSAPTELWLRALVQLPLPISSVVASGGRSLHALVRVDACSREEWNATKARIAPALVTLGADLGAMFRNGCPARTPQPSSRARTRSSFCPRSGVWPAFRSCDRTARSFRRATTPNRASL